jgi:peptidoglycan/xylan/chitin deacetylase (PgdA/CDA1 family)
VAKGQLATDAPAFSLLALRGVPVLLYHGITGSAGEDSPTEERKYWVTEAQFEEQLELIRALGRRVVLLREVLRGPLAFQDDKPAVVLTFDDGKASDYEAVFPALAQRGLGAEFFVNTSTVGQSGYLSWAQIAEMNRAGMSIQSHSHDHVALSPLPRPALEQQLRNSKHLLEDRLGCAVEYLAAPYGLWNRRVLAIASHAGYRALCNSRSWPARPGGKVVSRTAVYRHTSSSDLAKLVTGHPLWYGKRALRDASLYLPKRILLRYRPGILGVRVLEVQA